MNKKERRKIKEHIESEIQATEENVFALIELVKPIAPDNSIGRLSRMEAISAKSINEAALRAAKLKLAQLKSVLAGIDDPEFGLCIECGEPVPVRRILLVPQSKMCVHCASSFE